MRDEAAVAVIQTRRKTQLKVTDMDAPRHLNQVGEIRQTSYMIMVLALMICPAGGGLAISPTTARGGGTRFSAGAWTQGEVWQILRNRIPLASRSQAFEHARSASATINSSQRQHIMYDANPSLWPPPIGNRHLFGW